MATKGQDWKDFVRMLCDLGAKNTSQEIAALINRKTGSSLTWQAVAGVKASYTAKNR